MSRSSLRCVLTPVACFAAAPAASPQTDHDPAQYVVRVVRAVNLQNSRSAPRRAATVTPPTSRPSAMR
jgi:hypothetical protein